MQSVDPFRVSINDKNHPGRYGGWRLPGFRSEGAPNYWEGQTPKYVKVVELFKYWTPQESVMVLPSEYVYPCSVNWLGAVTLYIDNKAVPAPKHCVTVMQYWEQAIEQ